MHSEYEHSRADDAGDAPKVRLPVPRARPANRTGTRPHATGAPSCAAARLKRLRASVRTGSLDDCAPAQALRAHPRDGSRNAPNRAIVDVPSRSMVPGMRQITPSTTAGRAHRPRMEGFGISHEPKRANREPGGRHGRFWLVPGDKVGPGRSWAPEPDHPPPKASVSPRRCGSAPAGTARRSTSTGRTCRWTRIPSSHRTPGRPATRRSWLRHAG
jgi:hypothetical protein